MSGAFLPSRRPAYPFVTALKPRALLVTQSLTSAAGIARKISEKFLVAARFADLAARVTFLNETVSPFNPFG
jgi:hypothetical protein